MTDFLSRFLPTAGSRMRDRLIGSIRVNFDDCRMAGQRSAPVLFFTGVWAENTSGQNQFISDLHVELVSPVRSTSTATEWRVYKKPVVATKGANIPAHGRTDLTWDILIHLDQPLPSAKGQFKGFIKARGRKGFRAIKTSVGGNYEIADT
ncbi:MAG TPA: hypothetical protein VNL15_03140 [Dehalococcoidia bacterium]|nr:hypothetical protein [Dehalococcoidia bacterium]